MVCKNSWDGSTILVEELVLKLRWRCLKKKYPAFLCMAGYYRSITGKHFINNWFCRKNCSRCKFFNFCGCSYKSFAGWLGHELGWQKKGRRHRIFCDAAFNTADNNY